MLVALLSKLQTITNSIRGDWQKKAAQSPTDALSVNSDSQIEDIGVVVRRSPAPDYSGKPHSNHPLVVDEGHSIDGTLVKIRQAKSESESRGLKADTRMTFHSNRHVTQFQEHTRAVRGKKGVTADAINDIFQGVV